VPPDRAATEDGVRILLSRTLEQVMFDSAVAAEVLPLVERLRLAEGQHASFTMMLDTYQLAALSGLQRHEEALVLVRKLLGSSGQPPNAYVLALYVTARANEPLGALSVVEAAARDATDAEALAVVRQGFSKDIMRWMFSSLDDANQQESRSRAAEALLTLGWPAPDAVATLDSFRGVAIDARLARNDVAGASALAATVSHPKKLLGLLLPHRYDALFGSDADRVSIFAEALARFDRVSAERRRANPGDLDLLRARAEFLAGVGRNKEALALLLPVTSDMEAVARADEPGFWVVNKAASLLVGLGRPDEAVALMERMLALDMKEHPVLVNMAINHAGLLESIGRYREAAAYAAKLDGQAPAFASAYGSMWLWSAVVCGNALSGDSAAAAPWLRKIVEKGEANPAAHMHALICVDDLDGAEKVLLARVAGEGAEELLFDFQDYQLAEPAAEDVMDRRWRSLAARPAVRAAVARLGRILSLPLSNADWGEF
jgi:tetratricopeptide (TPR) repeat protein